MGELGSTDSILTRIGVSFLFRSIEQMTLDIITLSWCSLLCYAYFRTSTWNGSLTLWTLSYLHNWSPKLSLSVRVVVPVRRAVQPPSNRRQSLFLLSVSTYTSQSRSELRLNLCRRYFRQKLLHFVYSQMVSGTSGLGSANGTTNLLSAFANAIVPELANSGTRLCWHSKNCGASCSSPVYSHAGHTFIL